MLLHGTSESMDIGFEMDDSISTTNFQTFRDCLATPLIEKSTPESSKGSRKSRGNGRRRTAIKSVTMNSEDADNAEDLADFIDYLAYEIFTNLPSDLRTLTYSAWINSSTLQNLYSVPLLPQTVASILNSLSPTINDSLTTYNFLPAHTTTPEFLTPILQTYLENITTAPPPAFLTRVLATKCEICGRSWIPLTYHHLIPRGAHAKALKRGWHTEDQLNNVAWICRACHSFVHRIATIEELAKDYYTVKRLLEREDVQAFAKWVGRVRWKAS